MKNLILASFLSALSFSSYAQESDLTLAGEKWIAKFKNYNCAAFGPATAQPSSHNHLQVAFEQITTDSTLDNGLIKATFIEDGKTCRYSAIVFADNAAATMRLVTSKAFAPEGGSDCLEGKSLLDANFESNNYLYWGHPHNLSIMIPTQGAEAICPGNTVVGVNFVVAGRIRK